MSTDEIRQKVIYNIEIHFAGWTLVDQFIEIKLKDSVK